MPWVRWQHWFRKRTWLGSSLPWRWRMLPPKWVKPAIKEDINRLRLQCNQFTRELYDRRQWRCVFTVPNITCESFILTVSVWLMWGQKEKLPSQSALGFLRCEGLHLFHLQSGWYRLQAFPISQRGSPESVKQFPNIQIETHLKEHWISWKAHFTAHIWNPILAQILAQLVKSLICYARQYFFIFFGLIKWFNVLVHQGAECVER